MSRTNFQDFACKDTDNAIYKILFPALDQIARREFGVIAVTGLPTNKMDAEDILYSIHKIEGLCHSYLMELGHMYLCFGDRYAELGDCSRDSLDGDLEKLLDRQRTEILSK